MGRITLAFLPITIVILVIHLVSGQGWYCFQIIERNCYNYGYDPQCGSNNFTYYNKCEFTQGRCKDPFLHNVHDGACYNGSHTHNLTHGEEIALQFVCQQLSTHQCPEEFDYICGSDGVTYRNMCKYELRRCMHPDMTMVKKGPCDSTR